MLAMRYARLLAAGAAALLAGVCCLSTPAGAAEQAPRRPNVLMIAVDDLNDWIGCLGGHPQTRTPHLDALAARGVLFRRAYCAAPACNPSRTALLTGVRPSTSGVYLNGQPWRPALPDAVTLPQFFGRHGYDVVGGGKIFHGPFEDPTLWRYFEKKGSDPRPSAAVLADPHSRAGGIVWGALDVPDAEMNDHKIVSWANAYLAAPQPQPFFLAVGLYRPHMPWQVPRKYYEQFPLESIELPRVNDNDLDDVPPAGRRMARPEGDHATILATNNWRQAVQAYLASIAFADAQIGRLLAALDASPHRDNTIVILWGDHGWHLGEKHHWRKFALWEEATRTPLMVVAPGVTKPAGVCDRTVDFLHVYPTLADLCGLPAPAAVEGVSLRPLLEDPAAAWERPAITTHGRLNHAVRSERWRYIRYASGGEELYDHDADPLEWKNLASDPQYAGVKQELAGWLPKVNAADAPTRADGDAPNANRNPNQNANPNRNRNPNRNPNPNRNRPAAPAMP